MNTTLLILICIVALVLLGGAELALGAVMGVLLYRYVTTAPDKTPESFEGRQISLGDQCVRADEPRQSEMPYAPEWNDKSDYDNCYSPVSREFSEDPYKAMSIDEKSAQLAKLRARDKKCMDGVTSKNMYFYKKYYGDEIEREEAKPWWGVDEF